MSPLWLLFGLPVVAFLLWPHRYILDYISHKTGVLFYIPTDDKVVFITIDDGPTQYTDTILQTLKDLDVKVTFFLIGERVRVRQDVVERIYAAGHGIANHDVSNRRSALVDADDLRHSLVETNRLLENGQRIRKYYFRPGCGYFTPALLRVAVTLGMRVTLGDVYPFDPFMPTFWSKFLLRYKTQPGSIVILHDGTKGRVDSLCSTLREVVPILKKQGYRFEALL